MLQTEKAYLKQPKVFLWYFQNDSPFFSRYSVIDTYLFLICVYCVVRRNLGRERGLVKVEIDFGNLLVLDLRLLRKPLKVSPLVIYILCILNLLCCFYWISVLSIIVDYE